MKKLFYFTILLALLFPLKQSFAETEYLQTLENYLKIEDFVSNSLVLSKKGDHFKDGLASYSEIKNPPFSYEEYESLVNETFSGKLRNEYINRVSGKGSIFAHKNNKLYINDESKIHDLYIKTKVDKKSLKILAENNDSIFLSFKSYVIPILKLGKEDHSFLIDKKDKTILNKSLVVDNSRYENIISKIKNKFDLDNSYLFHLDTYHVFPNCDFFYVYKLNGSSLELKKAIVKNAENLVELKVKNGRVINPDFSKLHAKDDHILMLVSYLGKSEGDISNKLNFNFVTLNTNKKYNPSYDFLIIPKYLDDFMDFEKNDKAISHTGMTYSDDSLCILYITNPNIRFGKKDYNSNYKYHLYFDDIFKDGKLSLPSFAEEFDYRDVKK